MRLPFLLLALHLVLFGAAAPAAAKVERIEILRRVEVLGGKPFGTVGPYEKIVARAHFAVRPDNPHNRPIVDLELAPRNAAGRGGVHRRRLPPRSQGPRPRQRVPAAGDPQPGRQGNPVHRQSRLRIPRSGEGQRLRRRLPARTRLHRGLGGLAVGRARRAEPPAPPGAHRHASGAAASAAWCARTSSSPAPRATSRWATSWAAASAGPNTTPPSPTAARTCSPCATPPWAERQLIPRAQWSFGADRRCGLRALTSGRLPARQDLRAGLRGPRSAGGRPGVRGRARPGLVPETRPRRGRARAAGAGRGHLAERPLPAPLPLRRLQRRRGGPAVFEASSPTSPAPGGATSTTASPSPPGTRSR